MRWQKCSLRSRCMWWHDCLKSLLCRTHVACAIYIKLRLWQWAQESLWEVKAESVYIYVLGWAIITVCGRVSWTSCLRNCTNDHIAGMVAGHIQVCKQQLLLWRAIWNTSCPSFCTWASIPGLLLTSPLGTQGGSAPIPLFECGKCMASLQGVPVLLYMPYILFYMPDCDRSLHTYFRLEFGIGSTGFKMGQPA